MIFKTNAPKYWAKDLPAMPLRERAKIPALNAWQQYAAKMPSPEEQETWLESYPEGNIGLPLGPQAGIIAVDLDTEDPRVIKILNELLPPTPWTRVGKKGSIRAFKYNGERTYRIKDEEGNTLFEVLSRGAQMVLPPSIHPDTQLPYEANAELPDVLNKLVTLPTRFEEMARQALIDAGVKLTSRGSTKVTEWVPSGGRDSALVSMAGLNARAVMRGERTLMEAINEIEMWVASYTEKVVGDQMDPIKGRQKLLEFLRRDILEHNKQLPGGWDAGLSPEEIVELRDYFGEDIEEWDSERIFAYITQKFAEIGKDRPLERNQVIEEVLARIAKSEHLSTIDADLILAFIQNASGRQVTLASMRKRIGELKGSSILGTDHTEIARALLAELAREGEVRFQGSRFYQWYGSHWRELPDTEISRILAEQYGSLPAARKASDHKGIITTARTLAGQDLKSVDMPGINFANGFLTTDLQLLDHDPRFGATYVLPYRWMPNERAPSAFLSFLDQSWGEDDDYLDKIQTLREAIAVTLFGLAPQFSRAICLFGIAGSGKTTLMDIMLGMIPKGATCMVPPQEWGDKFMPAEMNGKLVNFCGELSETQMIPGNLFKMIVEGAEMTGQHKGRDLFKFRPLCSHWFASNHLPRSRDSSAGFNRRWLFLTFNKACPRELKRINLAAEIISEEREALVAWAIPAIQDLMRRQDYTMPRSHVEMVSEVATQNNSVRFFMVSGLVEVHSGSDGSVSNHISEKELFGLYYGFCKLSSHAQPVQLKRFRLAMQELQEEFGFKLSIVRSASGEVVNYLNLTVAKKKAA